MKAPKKRVRIQKEPFSIEEEMARLKATSNSMGGIVAFVGSARDISKGHSVLKLDYEQYSPMAEKSLATIRGKALQKFDIIDVTLVHRVGPIGLGENIVLVIVGAAHRQEAFRACAWCMDTLKKTVPIWKRETTQDGAFWVEANP